MSCAGVLGWAQFGGFSGLMWTCSHICGLAGFWMIKHGLDCGMSGCLHVTPFPSGLIMSIFMVIMATRRKADIHRMFETGIPSLWFDSISQSKATKLTPIPGVWKQTLPLWQETSSGKKQRYRNGGIMWHIDAINLPCHYSFIMHIYKLQFLKPVCLVSPCFLLKCFLLCVLGPRLTQRWLLLLKKMFLEFSWSLG